jgi:hypothetical protein
MMEADRRDKIDPVSGKSRKDEDLEPWIENMKSWMRQRATETDKLLARSRDGYTSWVVDRWLR